MIELNDSKKDILYLAPIRGVTTALFRNLYKRHFGGFDLAIAPFIATSINRKIHPKHLQDVVPENNCGFPLIPQILGNDPEGFICLAKALYDLGADTVNWNLGCPFPIVAKKKKGSGLLPFPERIQSILDHVVPRIPNKLSIKTRAGRNKSDEIDALFPIFNQYPLTELIIHPRTGIQMYDGIADIAVFQRCLEMSRHPLVYNGDIINSGVFESLKRRFHTIDRWMIGRGAISDPFLASYIQTGRDDSANKTDRFMLFHDELLTALNETLSGQGHLLDKMKGYWSYFFRSFKGGARLFKRISKIRQINEFQEELRRFFDSGCIWQPLNDQVFLDA